MLIRWLSLWKETPKKSFHRHLILSPSGEDALGIWSRNVCTRLKASSRSLRTLCCIGTPLGAFLLQPPFSLPLYSLKLFERSVSVTTYAAGATNARLKIGTRCKSALLDKMGRFIRKRNIIVSQANSGSDCFRQCWGCQVRVKQD